VVDSETYDAGGSFRISSVRKSHGNSVDTFTLQNVVNPSGSDFGTIAKKKLLENATIEAFLVNWKDPTEYYQDFKGFISRVKPRDFTYDIEAEGLSSLLLQNVMKTYENSCIWTFGDTTTCTFNTTTVQVSGSITDVTSRSEFEDTGRTEGDNHFRFGMLTFSTGNNTGISREVKSYDGISKIFVVFEPFPYEIQNGDAYDVYQGCDKSVTTCKDEFSNFENFGGYLYKVPKAEDLTWQPPEEDEV
jgi:uncharacterized phage protein (TIGR02218 family)